MICGVVMKKILVLLVFLMISGCGGAQMSNDEIIIEKDKCLKADMDYIIYINGLNKVSRVSCTKKTENKGELK